MQIQYHASNKTGLLHNNNNNNKDELNKIKQLITTLNPKAKVITTNCSTCDSSNIFNTRIYDVNQYSNAHLQKWNDKLERIKNDAQYLKQSNMVLQVLHLNLVEQMVYHSICKDCKNYYFHMVK